MGWKDTIKSADEGKSQSGWRNTISEKPKSRSAEAALEGFGEGATLGYLNNIQAAVEKPLFSVLNAVTGNDVQADDYVTARDYYNRRQAELSKENPKSFMGGQVAGTILSSMPVAKAAQGATVAARALNAARAGAVMGAARNTSEREGEISGLDLPERIENAVTDAGLSVAGSVGADALGAGARSIKTGVQSAKHRAGTYLKESAENLAENATGATGRQAEKFTDGTGRYLLDNKLVGAGDSAENIAQKVGNAISNAEQGIDDSLKSLDAKGARVAQNDVIQKIETQIVNLKKDPSQADTVRKLQGIVEDIKSTGQADVDLSSAEQFKRGFNKMAKNWQDPEKGQAGKIAYRAYRDAVEEAANASDVALGQQFKDSKQVFGKLQPVLDAAEKRSSQLNQSPWGGLGDIASEAVSPGGSVVRRLISPRLSSTAAVAADRASKMLLQNPQIAAVAQANPEAFKATVLSLFSEAAPNSNGGFIPAVAQEKPLKGEEKWVNDGLERLNQAGIPNETLEALKSTKQGRQILLDASDAKPNTTRWDSVMKRVRTASQGGQ